MHRGMAAIEAAVAAAARRRQELMCDKRLCESARLIRM